MLTRIKRFLKSFSLTKDLYAYLKILKKMKQAKGIKFYDNSNSSDTVCLVLAGYKEFLWDIVLERLKRFAPDTMDVCIVSSGLFSQKLLDICKKNVWSYISIGRNCVTMALNIAIEYFPSAQYIYKMDEDIFLTKDFFLKLRDCYDKCEVDCEYIPGFVAPLIPVNGYGYTRILDKFGLKAEYAKRYGKPRYAAGSNESIECNPESAKFLWGGGIPHLDDMNEVLSREKFSFSVCPIRFSIGAILFKRQTWMDMGRFIVVDDKEWTGMGADEAQLCSLAMEKSLAIIVNENTVVGHLSFGKQNETMKDFFLSHPERFIIKET
jgi:hypothetical protein